MKKQLFRILPIFLCLFGSVLYAQVGIGTSNPDSKSILDISSTSKGLLIPRLTTAQRDLISSPTNGLLIFNTDLKKIEVYTASGSGESFLTSGSSGSALIGDYNSGSGWTASNYGMAQSFASGGGFLKSITIAIGSIVVDQTNPNYNNVVYELNLFAGAPSCGLVGLSSCSVADLGEPIATTLFTIKQVGNNKINFPVPVYLQQGQVYTFSLTPTCQYQGFSWLLTNSNIPNGASYGINGNHSTPGDDFQFQTHYLTGWRGL